MQRRIRPCRRSTSSTRSGTPCCDAGGPVRRDGDYAGDRAGRSCGRGSDRRQSDGPTSYALPAGSGRGQGHLLREAGRPQRRARAVGGYGAQSRAIFFLGSTGASIRASAHLRAAAARGDDRQPRDAAHHQSRPGATAGELHQGERWPLQGHDHSRFRRRALAARGAGRGGLRHAAACLVDPAIGAVDDIDTAKVLLRTASGRIALISNSRRSGYGYDQRIEAYGSGRVGAASTT